MRPTSIRKISVRELEIAWDSGHLSRYSLEQLREICPCAACQGETLLLHRYESSPPDRSLSGRYDLVGIQQVGAYAIQLQWADGHNTGIYTWEHLLRNCQCSEHAHALRHPALDD